jgi:hypothetical protein
LPQKPSSKRIIPKIQKQSDPMAYFLEVWVGLVFIIHRVKIG